MWIDSHCHLDGDEFRDDRDEVLARAVAAGVDGLVAIGGGAEPGTLARGLTVARARDRHAGLKVWATVGVHPHDAACADEASWAELATLAADLRIVAIGEIGLDYHYDHSPREVQQSVFERQLGLAAECDLPVSIHCRRSPGLGPHGPQAGASISGWRGVAAPGPAPGNDAFEDCLAAIGRDNPPRRGVFHCFTGNRAQAEAVLALGWYLSFSGMLTFTKADELRAVAAWAPTDRILIETDAPYLAPVPHRGRRNEPAWVADTGKRLAELRGLSHEAVAALTRENFFRLFQRATSAAGEAAATRPHRPEAHR